jgi:hypothetical protein
MSFPKAERWLKERETERRCRVYEESFAPATVRKRRRRRRRREEEEEEEEEEENEVEEEEE